MNHERLRTIAAQAWRGLVLYYRNFPCDEVRNKAETLSGYDWTAHEKKLLKYVQPVISQILAELQSTDIRIGCGIVHVNSPLARRRLKLPVWGGINNSPHRKQWENHVFKSNSRQLMFRDPGAPKHLLTELMWRLQTNKKLGTGFSLSLFLSDKDPLYAVASKPTVGRALACSNIRVASFTKTGAEWRSSRHAPSSYDFLGINNTAIQKRFWDPMNDWLCEVGDDAAASRKGFEYSGGEGSDLVDNLIKPAIDTLRDMGRLDFSENEVPTNIFYLPDLIETEEVGGLTFQIVVEASAAPTAKKLRSFLRDVQWLFSQYVVHPLISAERNHALAGRTYREVHFSSDGLKQLIEQIGKAKTKVAGDKAKAVIDEISKHFETVESDVGAYWRGYPRQGFETACTVASLIDTLFVPNGNRSHSDIIRECGAGFEGLLAGNADMEPLFRQLFRGLTAEKELFLTPFYREHFVHSFHCFVLGIVLMAWGDKSVLPAVLVNEFRSKKKALGLLKRWFLVAMWHDVAYSLQKGHELLEGYVTEFLDTEKRGKRCRGLIPWHPSVGHLLQAKDLLDDLREVSKGAICVSATLSHQKVGADDLALVAALDKIDHGVWSALFFGHVYDKRYKKEIMRAIMVHHIADWGLQSVLKKDFELNEGMPDGLSRDDFLKAVGKGEHVWVSRDRENANPLGHLLFLSDVLSQWGREAPDIGGRVASRIGIRLDSIGVSADRSLEIGLRYDKFPVKAKELSDAFFTSPMEYFGYSCYGDYKAKCLTIELFEGKETRCNQHISATKKGKK